MTTPNIDLYLPKTYIFERKGINYKTAAYMTRKDDANFNYVNLPAGMSAVTITASAFWSGRIKVILESSTGGEPSELASVSTLDPTVRVWSGTISSPGSTYAEGAVRLRLQAQYITTAGMNAGSVSVQIVNFPPET